MPPARIIDTPISCTSSAPLRSTGRGSPRRSISRPQAPGMRVTKPMATLRVPTSGATTPITSSPPHRTQTTPPPASAPQSIEGSDPKEMPTQPVAADGVRVRLYCCQLRMTTVRSRRYPWAAGVRGYGVVVQGHWGSHVAPHGGPDCATWITSRASVAFALRSRSSTKTSQLLSR